MNPGWLRWGAAVPAAAYATALAVGADPPFRLDTLVVALALAVSLGSLATDRLGGWWFLPAVVAAGGTGVAALSSGAVAAAPTAPLVVGLLLGAPALALALVGQIRGSSALASLGLTGGLVVDAVVLAVVRNLPTASGASAPGWAEAATTVLSAQASSLRAFATGAAIPAAPLSYTGDAAFDALAVLALVGVLLSWLDPMARSPPAERTDGAERAYSPAATVGPTPGLGRSGTRSLVVAVGAVLVFEVAAALSPTDALLALAVTAPAVVTVIIAVTDRGSRTAPAAAR